LKAQLVVYPKTRRGGWSEDLDKHFLVRVRQWFDKYLKKEQAQGRDR
jgi:hypothetical protein